MSDEKCPKCGGDTINTVARKTQLEEVPAIACANSRGCGWHEQRGLFLDEQLDAANERAAMTALAAKGGV